MLQIIKNILQQQINQIDNGSCLLSIDKQCKLLLLLIDTGEPIENLIMSKLAASDYLGISRATFDNKVHDGLLPKGHKYPNFKELIWFKFEIDEYMINL